LACCLLAVSMMAGGDTASAQDRSDRLIRLPPPRLDGAVSVERALHERRSVREYADRVLTDEEIAQLLWAAQGITEAVAERPAGWPAEWQWMGGLRTAPSAGALYPLELYLVAAGVESLSDGLYRYVPQEHALEPVAQGDLRQALAGAALRQSAIVRAPAVFVVTAVYQRVAVKYGERAERYARIEVGAVAQNIYLQSEALGLGTVLIGAFDDAAVKQTLGIPADHEPLAIMPVGREAGN
jgi:SagB-type dehydrogenase family enzyme